MHRRAISDIGIKIARLRRDFRPFGPTTKLAALKIAPRSRCHFKSGTAVGISAEPSSKIGIVTAIECQVKIAWSMVVVPSETEGGVQRAVDFRPPPVGVVVVTRLDDAAAISELADAA